MGRQLRIVLPVVMGGLSIPLILWDIHNVHVIQSMGMGWDTGAPWQYQISDLLLRLLNGPAYSIAMPLASVLRLFAPMHFILVGPAIVVWWWFLGSVLDRGMVRWRLVGMLVVGLVLFLWSVTATSSMRLYYRKFHFSTVLTFLRCLTPAGWLLGLSCLMFYRTKPGGHTT